MKNSQRGFGHTLFNFLILLSFGLFLVLIKVLKQGSGKESVVIKKDDKYSERPKIAKKVIEEKSVQKIDGLNGRQEIIISEIRERGELTPKELKKLIPNVSTRTIRRDMDALSEKGLVSQKGSTKSTYYKYIG